MKFKTTKPKLVEIVLDQQGLEVMIAAAQLSILSINEWNQDDEYDTDVTPYNEMFNQLQELHQRFYQ